MPIARRIILSALASVALALGAAATAQDFPNKTVRLIVAFPTGSVGDTAARLMSPFMAKSLGQTVVVENRPGGDQRIGIEYVAKQAPADGHTVLVTATSVLSSIPALVKEPRFDPLKDLRPVSILLSIPIFLATNTQQPFKTFGEMVAYAKANPGLLNYASPNASTRLRLEAIINAQGLNVVGVSYGGATATPDMAILSNQVQLSIAAEYLLVQKDKVRPLAVTGEKRYARFPDVPTFRELGMDIQGSEYAFMVASGVPDAAVQKLRSAAVAALQQPELKAHFEKAGWEPVEDSLETITQKISASTRMYLDLARKLKMEPQ